MCFRFLQVTASFIRTGELPHHDHGHVDGIDEETIAEEINAFEMEDNLHPHDLTYKKRHPEEQSGPFQGRQETMNAAIIFILLLVPDADRHADLDLARPDRSQLPVHVYAGAARIGCPEAVHRHREVRDHGHSVLHSCRQLPDAWRGGATNDQVRDQYGRALVRWSGSRRRARLRLFAAVSGSSPATVVAIGSILMPAMLKAGFPNRFGAGVITTSGALGILIPPSIVMVMYSVATNTSVGALFMAGVIPGIGSGLRARRRHLVSGQEVRLPAHEEGDFRRALDRFP
jgi:hypothetical protein